MLRIPQTSLFSAKIAPHSQMRLISTSRSQLLPKSNVTARTTSCLHLDFRRSFSAVNRAGKHYHRFNETFAKVADELTEELRREKMPEGVVNWYRNNLEYNVPGGRLLRGLAVIDSVESIKRRPLSDKEYLQAAVLGWSVELLNAYFIVADDIIDASLTRREQPCWYQKPGVGMVAINDSAMLSSAVYRLLKSHFKNEPYYLNIVELFLECTWQTEIGQLVDSVTSPENVRTDLSNFSLELQSLTAEWKAAYYSCYLPVALAMHMCGIRDIPSIPTSEASKPLKTPYEVAKSILVPLGVYGQTQNDFFDYAGSPKEARKVGTDIITNKGSWCINAALVHATPEQRKILDEHYGRGESGGESESRVKAVFEEIGVREKYAEYEDQVVKMIRGRIAQLPETDEENTLRRELFETFLAKFYRRM